MARSPIEIALASETKAFKQGIESGVIAPLEDAIKQLRELGDTDGADNLEAQLRDAQRATEKLGDETKITAAQIERDYRDAYRQARQASDEGTGRMREGAQEVTQEIGANLGEAVSSVRGNLSDLGQVGQDTLGGLAATLAGAGPAGIAGAAALAAGAVGLGLVTAELQKQEEQAEALRTRMVDAYKAAAEQGMTYIDVAGEIANAQDLMWNPDRADEWQKVQDTQKKTGLDMSEVLKANAGDLDALAVVQARVTEENKKAIAAGDEVNVFTQKSGSGLSELRNFWDAAGNAAKTASDKSSEANTWMQQFLADTVNSAASATKEVDELGNTVLTLPNGAKIMIDAETGQATTDVSKFKGDLDGVAETVVKPVIKPRVDSSEWDKWTPSPKVGSVAGRATGMSLQ